VHVLAFRHVPFEDVGHIRPVLAARGIQVECVDLFRNQEISPDAANASGLIFMGGPMSANDDLDYLKQELRLIAQAAERGQPMLGVCLGSQLLAKALGGRVYGNPVKEIGWYEVQFCDAATEDPLFSGLGNSRMTFHWHGETFDLPAGATLLASSEACRHQAFRFGKAAYGLQFHPEVTPEMIADWCEQDANCGDMRELAVHPDPHAWATAQRELSEHLFGRWANLLQAGVR
jgi:GMP synthase (glutamine-hydrolysing)